ncbi:uncharacterized protein TNCV_1586581 [Trichonephila clavipes]|nr:uncharacterized protein TNCV_1586581 [Trichonephila clavipes]
MIYTSFHYLKDVPNTNNSLSVSKDTAAVPEWYRHPDRGWLCRTSSSPVPLKTRRVGQRCTLNLSSETSSLWCDVVVRRGGAELRCRPRHLTMVQNAWSIAKSPRAAEQCNVNLHSLTHHKGYFHTPYLRRREKDT